MAPEWNLGRAGHTEGVSLHSLSLRGFRKLEREQLSPCYWLSPTFLPGCPDNREAAVQGACHRGPRWRSMGAQALVSPLAGLAAPLVSSTPSRAKLLGYDGWGPRAPPSIPSSFPGPRAGLGNSLQPVLPGHPLARLGGPSRIGRLGSMLPGCGLSTLLRRAVCQGVQVPAWIPAPSQGAFGEAQASSWWAGVHLPRPLVQTHP